MPKSPKTELAESNTANCAALIPVIPSDGPRRSAFMRSVAEGVRDWLPSYEPDEHFEATVERLFGDWHIDPASRLIVLN